MSTGAIKMAGGQISSSEELAGAMPVQVNGMTDRAGALVPRPGISAWSDFPSTVPWASPVVAMGSWNGRLIYVTADRRIWVWLAPGNVVALSDPADNATMLDGVLRPVIVPTRSRVLIVGGGKPQKWEGSGLSARLGGNPPAMTHMVSLAQRLFGNANDPSGLIYWSNIGDTGAETWQTGLNYAEAETKPDPVVGLYENANELVAAGTQTVQMLAPDPSVVVSSSRTMQFGWGPAHSYIEMDEQFMGLDSKNRVVLSNGRSYSFPSWPAVGKEIARISDVSTCWGMRAHVDTYDYGVLTFPSVSRTFAYEMSTKTWSEWRGYDQELASLAAMPFMSAFTWEEKGNLRLVGLTDGRIAVLDPAATDDLGQPIVVMATSAFVSHSTTLLKKCNGLRITVRTAIAGTTPSKLLLSYRDDLGEFCEPIEFEIGKPDDPEPVLIARSLGSYRKRQWRIMFEGGQFTLAGVEEDFTILSN